MTGDINHSLHRTTGYEAETEDFDYYMRWLEDADTFVVAECFHVVKIRVKALDGYSFDYDSVEGCYMTEAFINAKFTTIESTGTDHEHYMDIYAYIGCNDETITFVDVLINAPVAGEAPVLSATLTNSGCTVKEVYWYDYTESDGTSETATLMKDGDTFVTGGSYEVHIIIEADDGYVFQPGYYGPNVTASVNGMETGASLPEGADGENVILITWFFDCMATEE